MDVHVRMHFLGAFFGFSFPSCIPLEREGLNCFPNDNFGWCIIIMLACLLDIPCVYSSTTNGDYPIFGRKRIPSVKWCLDTQIFHRPDLRYKILGRSSMWFSVEVHLQEKWIIIKATDIIIMRCVTLAVNHTFMHAKFTCEVVFDVGSLHAEGNSVAPLSVCARKRRISFLSVKAGIRNRRIAAEF